MSEQEAKAAGDDWSAAMAEQAETGQNKPGQTTLHEEHDDGFGERSEEEIQLDVLLDVPVTVSMEIGRSKLPIRNLLQLNQGSVVELDRMAGEPLDVLVNGTLIAHGEVVVVNEKFGIRLTDVISPAERVRKLK